MKHFITKLIFSYLVVSSLHLTAQDRVNAKYIEFEHVSDTLKTAIGWKFDDRSEKWAENENTLYRESRKSDRDDPLNSMGDQNFIYIVTNSVTVGKEKVYVIFVNEHGSYYKYPALKEGVVFTKRSTAYVITESEFRKLDKIEKGKVTEVKVKQDVGVDKNNPDSYRNALTKAITEKPKYKSEMTFRVTRSEDGSIRFTLPGRFSKYSDYGFDKGYFETDDENFSRIILK
jgi:hypothetical protein